MGLIDCTRMSTFLIWQSYLKSAGKLLTNTSTYITMKSTIKKKGVRIVKRLYYQDVRPIDKELEDNWGDVDYAIELSLMYVLYKGGFLETGIHPIQLDAMVNAYLEVQEAFAKIIEKEI